MKTDVQVMDGNAKSRRLVCAALLRHKISCRRLGCSLYVGCPHTPLGSLFCGEHGSDTEPTTSDYEIIKHEAPEA
eukprot:4208528-Karenia_brevis.AAC.1